jgi:hypothetical protein
MLSVARLRGLGSGASCEALLVGARALLLPQSEPTVAQQQVSGPRNSLSRGGVHTSAAAAAAAPLAVATNTNSGARSVYAAGRLRMELPTSPRVKALLVSAPRACASAHWPPGSHAARAPAPPHGQRRATARARRGRPPRPAPPSPRLPPLPRSTPRAPC